MTGVLKLILLYLLMLTGLIGIIHFSIVFINRPPAGGPVSASPRINSISRDFVYDLSGSEASGLGDAMKLFDENCDPKNDPSSSPVTQPLPVKDPDKFFVPGRGLRIVVDLQAGYTLDELYWYDKSPESDSIWLYTGNMHHWEPALAYRSAGSPGGWGWRTFRLQARSRYVMIRFNSPKSVLTEMVLYGRREEVKKVDRSPSFDKLRTVVRGVANSQALARPSLREFAGTNAYDFVPPYLLASFHDTRVYQFLKWYDADTVHPYPHNRLSLPWGLAAFADSLRRQGNRCWMSIRGIPAWMEKKGMNERDKPVTRLGIDTEDPLSYGRHARSFWTLAALFGHTRVDTSLIELEGSAPFSGAGLMDRFENGNEEDGWWSNYYWNPMDYFALSSADYDGHEGRLGPGHGLKKADTASRLIMSGLVQTDTNRVRTLAFLCAQLRNDHRFVWEGGVQYHYYSTDSKSISQMPTRGISPEEDRLREKLARVRAFHDRVLPGVPLILGENGYDRNQGSRQRTPLLPGHNEAQSQGIMVLRSMMAVFMAGFDGYNQYMMRDATNDPLATGPYASSGMLGGPQTNMIFPAWHYWNAAIQMLGNYRADSILCESGPVWVYRLRHRDYPDSLAYYLVSPTTNGAVIKKYRLFAGLADNQPFKVVKLIDGSVPVPAGGGRAANGFIELPVDESPTIVFLQSKK